MDRQYLLSRMQTQHTGIVMQAWNAMKNITG